MKKVMRMFKSILARKKRTKTKEVIETIEKRQKPHDRHQKEKIKKFPKKYSERAKESLYKKLKVE